MDGFAALDFAFFMPFWSHLSRRFFPLRSYKSVGLCVLFTPRLRPRRQNQFRGANPCTTNAKKTTFAQPDIDEKVPGLLNDSCNRG